MNAPAEFPDIICPKRKVRRMCAEAFGFSEQKLLGHSRKHPLVVARQATCYVLRRRWPEFSYPQMGRFMGGRDHSTVINAVRCTEERMRRDPQLAALVQSLIAGRIGGQFEAHVLQWRVWCAYQERPRDPLRPFVPLPDEDPNPEDELAEFADPAKLWCAQCDRAVSRNVAAGCKTALWGLAKVRTRVGQQVRAL